jgi:hypothetical protein
MVTGSCGISESGTNAFALGDGLGVGLGLFAVRPNQHGREVPELVSARTI